MSKIKLTTYLNKIESKYIKAREDWENLQKELKEEETRYQNIKWINLSSQGKVEEQNAHIKKNREISQRLEQIRKDFEKSVSDIVRDSDKVFNRAYQYTSEDVDMNGVAILQNGNMNDKELIELAKSYRLKGNNTMYFMVAEKLKHDKPFEMLSDTEREAEEFIIYWLPKLENNKYNYIRFAKKEEINTDMLLNITPSPDTTIRVLMTYKKLNKPINVEEQIITTPERKGFVAVEWGGTEIK